MTADQEGGPRLVSEGPYFAQLWESVLFDKRLSPSAVRVYACLQRFAAELGTNALFPSQDTIGARISMDRETVRNALQLLADCGHITRERTGRGWTVTIKTPARRAGKSSTKVMRENPASPEGKSSTSSDDMRENPARHAGKSSTNRETEGELQSKRAPQTPRKRGAVQEDPAFDTFWSFVVRREPGRTKAREAWDKALSRGADPQAIIDGIRAARPAYLAAEDKTKVPHITTWLNQHRWEEVPAMPGEPPESTERAEESPEDREARLATAAAQRAALEAERAREQERLDKIAREATEKLQQEHTEKIRLAQEDPERPENVDPGIWANIHPDRRGPYAAKARRELELAAQEAAWVAARQPEEPKA